MGVSASTVQPTRDFELLDLYEILEVKEDATVEEIKKAYRRQSREHHPDRNVNNPGATRRFTHVLEAYQTLTNQRKRALYDRLRSDEKLAHKKHTTTPLPISPRDMPGSWAWTSESTPEPNDPLGLLIRLIAWLLRVLLLVPPKLQKQPILPRQCFDYEEYAAKARANPYDVGPGISLDDIHHFLASIEGESFELDDDHNNRAGLFFRAQNFFLCVAMDELRRGSSHIPLFGCAHSIWSYNDWNWDHEATHLPSGLHEVEGFYAYWARFETRKCFEWVKNDSNRQMDGSNKEAQWIARRDYDMGVRMVVQHFLQIDPRYHIHMLQAQRYAQHRPAEGDPVPAHLNRKERHKRKGRA